MPRARIRDRGGTVRTGKWGEGVVTVTGTEYAVDDVTVLPPVEPRNVVLTGANYPDRYGPDEDFPDRPPVTMRPASALAAHGDTVTLPPDRVVFEAELGVVIGEHCKAVPERRAMEVVAGFTCVDDLTRVDEDRVFRKKAFDGAMPIGPCVAPPGDVPADASIELRVNGEPRQRARRSDLLFSVPELVAAVTGLFSLDRGDVISTGTPAGRAALADGDAVEVEIEGVGTLAHDVAR